jgi:hypothetical protein
MTKKDKRIKILDDVLMTLLCNAAATYTAMIPMTVVEELRYLDLD